MKLEYLPLLQVQRDLYQMPRGLERFREYLRTMIDARTGDLELPLVALNPMGKDHVPQFLDALIAMLAEDVAAAAVAETGDEVKDAGGDYRVCLVVSDDKHGGWTNRHTSELDYRFHQKAYYARGWIAVLLWTSETYTPAEVRDEVRLAVFRAAHVHTHGVARTLREMLVQEGTAMALAGAASVRLEPEDLAYTRDVLIPHLDASDPATQIAALFGDAAARTLGHLPLGLSERAGLALAPEFALGRV